MIKPHSPLLKAILLVTTASGIGCSCNKNLGHKEQGGGAEKSNTTEGAISNGEPKRDERSIVRVEKRDNAPIAGLYYRNNVVLTREVISNLRAIIARAPNRNNQVFIRIGDSISSGGKDNPFACFAKASGQPIELGEYNRFRNTIDFFDAVSLKGGRPESDGRAVEVTSSWARNSYAASVGVGASWPLRTEKNAPWNGSRPVEKEDEQTSGRFAIWMLGTNDTSSTPLPYRNGILYRDYANAIVKTVEYLTARGIIPVLTYIPPVLNGNEIARWESADMVAIERAIAVAKKVPTIDVYSGIAAIGKSAFWNDGIHLASSKDGACLLTENALRFGVNYRNLRTLEVLEKLRRVVTSNIEQLDEEPPMVTGRGTNDEPVDIPGLPFGFSSTFDEKTPSKLSNYVSCGGASGQNGSEAVYRIDLTQTTALRAIAIAGECENSDVCTEDKELTIAVFRDKLDMSNCVSAGTTLAKATLTPGRYYLVMDSALGKTHPKSGILALHQCISGDTRCTSPSNDEKTVSPR